MFLVPSDNQFGLKRSLSSSHAIYRPTIKSVVNERSGILSGSRILQRHQCCLPVGWIPGRQVAARYLRDKVAPEERAVD